MERQSTLKEVATNKNLQSIIDSAAEAFRPLFWPNFFDWEDVNSLKYETLVGESGPGAAASVVSYDSAAPLRTRKAAYKLTGDIPSIREKFKMSEQDLLNYIILSKMGSSDGLQVIKMIMDDVRNASEAPHKRLDMFVAEALSTGKMTLNTTNNPDGLVYETAFDFGIPAANKTGVSVLFSDTVNSKPITDFTTIMNTASGKGYYPKYQLMHRNVWNLIRKSPELAGYVTSWAIGKSTPKANLTLDLVNEFLLAEHLPIIKIIDLSIGVEKDGVVTNYNPFSSENICFLTDLKCGTMKNAPIVEKELPVDHVTYAEYNKVLVKKWGETDPVAEFTGCELNAFPSWKSVNSCFLLDTANVGSFT